MPDAKPDAKLARAEPARRHSSMRRFQRAIASPTSGALAYTVFCLVTLLFAFCVAQMPLAVIERAAQLREMLG